MTRTRRGQTTVEFALVIPIFIILMMAVLDLGLAIYKFNGVSQAAREIARAVSVHPCTNPNACTPEVAAVIATQKNLIPGLVIQPFRCVYPDGTAYSSTGTSCTPGNSVRVTATAPYNPVTPLLGLAQLTLQSSSTVKIQ